MSDTLKQDTFEVADDDGAGGGTGERTKITRKKKRSLPRTVVNPDGNFYFYWLMVLTFCVLYNLWTLIVRQSFPELQSEAHLFWIMADAFTDLVFLLDIAVQFRTGYLEQGLMVYKTKKLARHYIGSKPFYFDLCALLPTDLCQLYFGTNPMFRFPRFLKIYRTYNYYYMVESRTVYPNVWRVVNLIHILLLLAHWFGCFYFLLSEAEHFKGPWVYPDPKDPNNTDFAPLTRKYLGSLYWSTLTLTTIGDLPTPYSNWQLGNRSTPFNPSETIGFRTQAHKSRLLYIRSDIGYLFTIISYLIGVFIFATIVGQVGNVITNRNANRLEFERLLDGAKMYMRHHKVPRDMQRRVLRWYDYSWSRGRIQGGGDINTALGLLPDKLKTELALHVNLSVLKKVTIFQECQPEFLHDLVLKMKAYIFTPGDLICRKGEVAREMFIIADGILEVISETGKVLTTMQAGDFFGEIGILNLDGLNKRTADVRSVGYSELFSLSREDVLAAMKDYPEAQEILQTLGRKRLMEARKASGAPNAKKPSASDAAKKLQAISLTPKEAPECSGPVAADSTAGKRIVEKLQSDFKGLKDVIRRSRKSNSSKDDSSEPESGKPDGEGPEKSKSRKDSSVGRDAKSFPPPRGVLKRMHNVVLSDEKDKEPSTSASTSTSSPSTLSKIRIVTAKGKRVQLPLSKKSPPSPNKEPEVIGEGLPLMQRLRLLKQKEDRERKQQEEREVMMQSLIPGRMSQSPASLLPGVVTEDAAQPAVVRTKASVESQPTTSSPVDNKEQVTLRPTPVEKNGDKRESVSSMESGSTLSSPPSGSLALRALSPPLKAGSLLIGEAAAIAASRATTEPISIHAAPTPPRLSSQTSLSPPVFSGSMSPPVLESLAMTIGRDRSASASSAPISSSMTDPHSSTLMRPAALHFRQKTYGSVDDLSPEFSRLPFVKKLKILNERQKIAVLLMSKTGGNVLTRSTSEGSNENTVVSGAVCPEATEEDQMHSLAFGRRTQSNQEQLQGQGTSDSEATPQGTLSSSPTRTSSGPPPKYDQSPPERDGMASEQKRPNGEHSRGGGIRVHETSTIGTTVVQSSIAQIQPKITTTTVFDSNATKCLTKLETELAPNAVSSNSSMIQPSRLSPSPTSSAQVGAKKRRKTKKIHTASPTAERKEDEDTSSSSSSSTPSPPELDSSETPERRNLKSILKRLAKSEEAVETESKRAAEVPNVATAARKVEERKLLKAPTIEGYAARHRKFAKNVTFHRQAVTVVSPEDANVTKPVTGAQRDNECLRKPDMSQGVRPDEESCEVVTEFNPESEIGTQADKLLPVSERVYVPDNMKSLTNLMVVKGEDLEYAGERHPGALQFGLNIAQEECIGSVFMGIKAIIQSKVDEIHSRFQDNYSTLEQEVRKRDEIIFRLQRRIQELERKKSRNGNGLRNTEETQHDFGGHEGDNEMDDLEGDIDDDEEILLGSEASMQRRYPLELQSSYLFSRGDSIDTVISAQDFDDEVFERAEIESREASQALSQPIGEDRSSQYSQQHRRRSRDNGDGQKKSSATWAHISEEETIEMRELTAPWQVEFHRDRDSLPPPNERNLGTRNLDRDTVAVDIGASTSSAEYDSSASSGAEERKEKALRAAAALQEVGTRKMREEPVVLDEEDDEEGEQTEEESDEESDDTTEDDEPQLTNKNWEVQMLAKEMDKIEKTKGDNTEMLGEAQHLQNEIKEMRDAVTSGELSPSELDMLESILESKSRRVKAIVKALSVETPFPPGRAVPSTSRASRTSPRGKDSTPFVRSVDDLPNVASSSSFSRPLHSNQFQSLTPAELPSSSGAYSQPRFSLGYIVPSLSTFAQHPSTSAAASESTKLSPGEKRDLHKLMFPRKRASSVKRQTSLCESSLAQPETSTTAATRSQRRRESAGAFPISVSSQGEPSTKSFFSRFSLVRQFTSRGFHGTRNPSAGQIEPTIEPTSTEFVEASCTTAEVYESTATSALPITCSGSSVVASSYSTTSPDGQTMGAHSQQRSSSVGVLPRISSTITSVLSSSVKSDPGTFQSEGHITTVTSTSIAMSSSERPISSSSVAPPTSVFTIPPAPSYSAEPSSSRGAPAETTSPDASGECQPLLKK
ncbi:unnamed protein product [Orchesella dallaii]|uniref:Cyclic nucleotide-binding domain-containing protein n=1 Tax=Orchesella dallaii TaxID=48710 RepID=A0ABP1PXV5_9HEXA